MICDLPNKRAVALVTNSVFYYTGKLCRNAHLSKRYTKDGRCLDCIKIQNLKDIERRRACSRQYNKLNKDSRNEYRRKWLKTNRHKQRARKALRRALLKNATHIWVNKEQLRQIYALCPETHEVDHVIPLTSNVICGLHVPWNLQYLTPIENRMKHNIFNIADI